MNIELKSPSFTTALGTSLARGGDIFQAKRGYLNKGDVLYLKKDSDWQSFDNNLVVAGSLGSKLQLAKGSIPADGDFYVVNKASGASTSKLDISFLQDMNYKPSGETDTTVFSASGDLTFDTTTLNLTTTGTGDVTLSFYSGFTPLPSDATDQRYMVKSFIYKYETISNSWTEISYDSSQPYRPQTESSTNVTTATIDHTGDFGSVAQDDVILWVVAVQLKNNEGDVVDTGAWTSSGLYDASTEDAIGPQNWNIDLFFRNHTEELRTIVNPVDPASTSYNVDGGTTPPTQGGAKAINLTNGSTTDGGQFKWGPVYQDIVVLDDGQTAVGTSSSINTVNYGLGYNQYLSEDTTGEYDGNADTQPEHNHTVVAVVNNANADGDEESFNFLSPAELVFTGTNVVGSTLDGSSQHNINNDFKICIRKHPDVGGATNPITANTRMAILFMQESTASIGDYKWFSNNSLMNVAWGSPSNDIFTQTVDIQSSSTIPIMRWSDDVTLANYTMQNGSNGDADSSGYSMHTYASKNWFLPVFTDCTTANGTLVSAGGTGTGNTWNGGTTGSDTNSQEYLSANRPITVHVIFDFAGDGGFGSTTPAGVHDVTNDNTQTFGAQFRLVSESIDLRQPYGAINMTSIGDRFIGETINIDWNTEA